MAVIINHAKDFKDSWKQVCWKHDIERYARAKKTLPLSIKLGHEKSIQYWKESREELEKRYPQLKLHTMEL